MATSNETGKTSVAAIGNPPGSSSAPKSGQGR
jgi:hypothetical protein